MTIPGNVIATKRGRNKSVRGDPYRADSDGQIANLGDLDAFAACLFDIGNPALSFGAGPLPVAATASEEQTGDSLKLYTN